MIVGNTVIDNSFFYFYHECMRRWFFLGFFTIFLTLGTKGVSAQQQSERWVCLNPVYCADAPSQCSNNLTLIQTAHSARLNSKSDAKPLPNTETYIVECFANTEARTETCTTGNPTTDNKIFKVNNVAKLKSAVGYEFEGMRLVNTAANLSQPRKSNATGDLEALEWRSSTPQMQPRKWLALNYFTENDPANGQGGQQQGLPTFETAAKNCVSINWDPYGRVFDSSSLEPIPSATVQLQKKRDNGLFSLLVPSEILGGSVTNPYTTSEDGGFSFVVPDGTYRLLVSHPSYTFPAPASIISQAISFVYKNIYPSITGEEIVQKGRIERRDVPLVPKSGAKSYPVKLMEYFYTVDKLSNQIVLEGRTSHPFATVKIWTEKVDPVTQVVTQKARLVASEQTDAEGKFKIFVSQQSFALNESFGSIELVKKQVVSQVPTPLFSEIVMSLVRALIPQVTAQSATTSVRVDPILTYVEGYAYDAFGKVLPNAKVGVYLTFSQSPYYQTTTDKNGYFKITSEHLPNMQFVLRYSTAQGQQTSTTTSKFVSQNAKFVTNNKINLNRYKDEKGQTPADIASDGADGFMKSQLGNVRNGDDQNSKKTSPGGGILVVGLILLGLLTAAGVILGVYVMRKQRVS